MESWPARLAVERVRARSVVTAARSRSPLRLLVPASEGGAAWVYQSSLGGGFVGTDHLALRVEVATGASLFLSSQASSKVYRAARARFTLDAAIGEDAVCVAWPDPVVCFAGASFQQVQQFALAATASVLVVDAYCAGRVARDERWAFDRLALRLAISRAGTPLLDDAVLLSPAHGELRARMAGRTAFATIAIAGPRFDALAGALVAAIAAQPIADPVVTATRHPWGALIRIAAGSVAALTDVTRSLVRAPVAAVLGADPWTRKW